MAVKRCRRITQQVDAILMSERGLTDAAQGVADHVERSVAEESESPEQTPSESFKNNLHQYLGILYLQLATRFFTFISSNQQRIRDFFTGIRDEVSPVIHRVWTAVRTAFPCSPRVRYGRVGGVEPAARDTSHQSHAQSATRY